MVVVLVVGGAKEGRMKNPFSGVLVAWHPRADCRCCPRVICFFFFEASLYLSFSSPRTAEHEGVEERKVSRKFFLFETKSSSVLVWLVWDLCECGTRIDPVTLLLID